MKESNKFLGTEKISKLLVKFAIPCILSLLISSLYNIVDQIFIGNSEVGYLGNAATTIVYPVTVIAVAFAWCFGDGCAAFLSLCQGRNDTKDVHKAIGNGICITTIISIIFIILGFAFMDNILYAFGASQATIGLSEDYFRIIVAAIPVYMIANMLNAVIRADGSPAFSMVSTLSGAIINIILDPIFIFVFKLGIKGAAIATIIGQFISFVISIAYLFRTKTFKLKMESFKVDFGLFNNVIKLGVSTFITQMSIVVVSLVCNIMLAKYGAISKYGSDIPIAVIGIAMKVFTIVINIVVGIILGAQPILGFNYGAKNYNRVKQTFKAVMTSTLIIGIIATLVFELCPQIVIKMFGTESDLYMEFAKMTFKIYLMLVTFTCTIKMLSIFFQAVGEPVKAAAVSLLRDIICFVPLAICLCKLKGIEGLLWAAPISDFMGIIFSITLTMIFFKNLEKGNKKCKSNQTLVHNLNSNEDNLNKSQPNDPILRESHPGVIITIARQHGSQGKYIGKLVANKLNIPYYYKEMTIIAAKESGLDKDFVSDLHLNSPTAMNDMYLSSSPVQFAIQAQDKVIKEISNQGSCVIVGRAADYILKDNKNVVRVFIYAPKEYRISNIMEMYKDSRQDAVKNIDKSDKTRSNYYKTISGLEWGNKENYDICINSSVGKEETADIICDYINRRK